MLENELDKINEQKPAEEQRKLAVSLAGLGKRSIVAVIDLFIMVFLAFVMMVLVLQPIYRKFTDVNAVVAKQDEFKIASKLFYEDVETNKIHNVDVENHLVASKAYFEDYCVAENQELACSIVGKTLAEAVLLEKWFEDYYSTDDNGQLVYIGEEALRADVEKYVYNYAVTQFANSEQFLALTKRTDNIFNMQVFLSVSTMMIVFYFVIPLLLKDGKTLGKLFFRISLTNSFGYKITKTQIFIRFVSFYLINFILGLYMTYFISVFISFTLMIFTKNQVSIHDFGPATIVVDDASSIIYKNKKEHEYSINLENEARKKILFKRQLLKQEQSNNKNE